MDVQQAGPTYCGPENWFTGEVWIVPIVARSAPHSLSLSKVHFAPGARTAWHSHKIGQTLYITEGQGRVQSRGEAIRHVSSGDVVHTAADEWHWHGAAPEHFMTHLSLTEGETQWGEFVDDTNGEVG